MPMPCSGQAATSHHGPAQIDRPLLQVTTVISKSTRSSSRALDTELTPSLTSVADPVLTLTLATVPPPVPVTSLQSAPVTRPHRPPAGVGALEEAWMGLLYGGKEGTQPAGVVLRPWRTWAPTSCRAPAARTSGLVFPRLHCFDLIWI